MLRFEVTPPEVAPPDTAALAATAAAAAAAFLLTPSLPPVRLLRLGSVLPGKFADIYLLNFRGKSLLVTTSSRKSLLGSES